MPPVVIHRGQGSNPAERRLKQLCDHSFLRFWSYPGVYRDQGKTEQKGDGKEVCDLLVVFENHMLIFSDKDCEFPNTGNLDLDWCRWYRKAIRKSAEQIWGAERWILSHPHRLFLDRSCTIPFPISLPDPSVAKIHRIVVAHDASEHCIRRFGGTGSLIIFPDLIGDMHCGSEEVGSHPFWIGQINPHKGFVHIFDDTSLTAVMSVLDTITDFTNYLTKKESFISSGKLMMAAGEDELLAFYLQTVDDKGEYDFAVPLPDDAHRAAILEGWWDQFSNSPERKAQLEANDISYDWDALIERFSRPFFEEISAASYYFSCESPEHFSQAIRLLAREPRARRYDLARQLAEFAKEKPQRKPETPKNYKFFKFTRTIVPRNPADPYYVFLRFPQQDDIPYQLYRQARTVYLQHCCVRTRLNFPKAQDVVGIAINAVKGKAIPEDFAYFDARSWTSEIEKKARSLERHLNKNLIDGRNWLRMSDSYYPRIPVLPPSIEPFRSLAARLKRSQRNAACPCGSGQKFKKCCGKKQGQR